MMGSHTLEPLPGSRRPPRHRWRIAPSVVVGILAVTGWSEELRADQPELPLHARIDQLVEAAHVGQPAPLASDSEFLRRIHLDLIGRIPDTETVRTFISDESPDKRAVMIDRLLASPEHVRHLSTVFDVMLMERRRHKYVKQEEWENYLLESFSQGKPYLELVRELLASDGAEPERRAAARFFLEREVEPNLLTRDISRIFLGRDIQCSQCHDHPLIDDYYQSEYYGLYAFVGRSSLFVDAKNENTAYVAEKGEGDVSYKSVFTEIEGESRPQLLDQAPLEEPIFAPGDQYLVKPDKDVRPVPKYSRRARLAEELAQGDHPAFRRNLANRLWAWMMGRGLVEPVDLHHSGNPPQHAEVLDLLAQQLGSRQFDIREVLRQLALTRVYQRSIDSDQDWLAQIEQAVEQLDEIEAQLAEAVEARGETAEVYDKLKAEIRSQRNDIAPLEEAYREARQAEAVAAFAAREAEAALQGTSDQLAARQPVLEAVQAAATAASQAAEKLPDEEELASAANQFVAKAKAIAEEVSTLRTTAQEQRQAAETTSTAAQAAQTALDQAEQPYTERLAPLRELEAEQRQVAEELDRRQSRRQVIQRQLARARALQARQEPLTQQIATRDQLERLAVSRTEVTGQIEQLAGQLAEQQERVDKLQDQFDRQARQVAECTEQRQARANALQLLQAADSSVTQAVAELPDDKELSAARDVLEVQRKRLAELVTTLDRQLEDNQQDLNAGRQACEEAAARMESLSRRQGELQRKLSELDAERSSLEEEYSDLQKASTVAMQELENLWTEQAALAPLKNLWPEQLAWSILEATGVIAAHRRGVEKELDEKPETAELDEAARAAEIEKGIHAKLQSSVDQFVRLFGAAAGQPQDEFFATVDQALFFTNGGQLQSWLAPSGNNLSQRLIQLEDPREIADELYLSVLTRLPSDDERQWVASALAENAEAKSEIVQELAWALLTSAEFRFCP